MTIGRVVVINARGRSENQVEFMGFHRLGHRTVGPSRVKKGNGEGFIGAPRSVRFGNLPSLHFHRSRSGLLPRVHRPYPKPVWKNGFFPPLKFPNLPHRHFFIWRGTAPLPSAPGTKLIFYFGCKPASS